MPGLRSTQAGALSRGTVDYELWVMFVNTPTGLAFSRCASRSLGHLWYLYLPHGPVVIFTFLYYGVGGGYPLLQIPFCGG